MTSSRARQIRGVLSGLFACLLLGGVFLPMHSQATTVTSDAPIPIAFPRDDGPHDSNVEWWYFTGHLFTEGGDRYGFEFVIFRARSGDLEGFVSHFAVTDTVAKRFRYDQRIRGSAGVAGSTAPLDLRMDGWTMRGGGGEFDLAATMPGYGVRLRVAAVKPAALHDGDGYIDYGNGTASYYYSWTRMDATGWLDLGAGSEPVSGEAWMDHQWGDFATFEEGGWDWFAVQLADGSDVMLYLIRDGNGTALRVDGSIVGADGQLTVLGDDDFTVAASGEWTSPETGTTYPSEWTLKIPSAELVMRVRPVMPDQELDTRPTTGVIYWEGEVIVDATRRGRKVEGLGYVELTGYAPYVPLDFGSPLATLRGRIGEGVWH